MSRTEIDDPNALFVLAVATPDDIEIELEPYYELDKLIRARSVAITLEAGEPGERDV